MRAKLLGCPIDILSMRETVKLTTDAMRHRKRLQHVALNVAKFVNMRSDPLLKADVIGSDLVGIDGMGILLAAWCSGLPVKERVTGIDLFMEVLAVCEREHFRPFFLGATPQVLEQAVKKAYSQFPSLKFAGTRDGYFGPDQESDIVEQIMQSGADCLFIGMPTPRKERFLSRHRDRLGVPFIMGVGGSFDILAGQVRRAPGLMQSVGLEWLYRVYQEPRRMWWRYFRTNVLFVGILMQVFIHRLVLRGRLSHAD